MKPTLDRVVDMIVDSLSGEAQDFYNREFSFFDEVTSISAKLKPFIKSSKAEKKVSRKPSRDPGLRLNVAPTRHDSKKSTRKWPRSRSMSACTYRATRTESSSTSTVPRDDPFRVMPK